MQKLIRKGSFSGLFVIMLIISVILGVGTYVLASSTSEFSQVINPGTLTTDIRSDSSTSVGSPAVTMGAKTFSFDCQSGGSASTGTFGTASERIYVDNPDAADGGWTLTLAAAATTTTWGSGSNYFDFNDAGGSGCTDTSGSTDPDSYGGQMTVNPATGAITTDYSGSDTTGISLGSSSAYVQGTTDTITLVTASSASADIWRGYFTGISMSQTIPAEQAADTYTIDLTLSVTAS